MTGAAEIAAANAPVAARAQGLRSADRPAAVALSGWGRFPRASCRLYAPASEGELGALVAGQPSLIARGNGRAYGDAALNPAATVAMRRFNRILSFDEREGLIVCEGGALLSDVIAVALPSGWFPPVVPGTKHVSVGGMVAADIHGKNHPRAGSFARHVRALDMMLGDGTIVRCSPSERPALFEATLGGMGLTGIVIRATFALARVESALMTERTIRCDDLEATFGAFEENRDATYAVAWIDCLSHEGSRRSLVQLGEHAAGDDTGVLRPGPLPRRAIRVPPGVPAFLLNRTSVAALNAWRFARARVGERLVPLDRFFFPLDAIADWNRLYGRRGLLQYQVALAEDAAPTGIRAILDRLSKAGLPPFLAVLKRFGPGRGMLSFPMPGYTLALDFAATREAVSGLAELDPMIAEFGGRLYLAKDALSTPASIASSYPGLAAFSAVRDGADPRGRFSSLLSRRLGL